jgi:hypothetical protein
VDDVRAEILSRLADGESLASICRSDGMPAWSTVHRWMDDDDEFVGQITRAREIGYQVRADRAIADAKSAEDAAKGRLAFDAERWYLGKLSNAFSDNKAQKHEHDVRLKGIEIEFVDSRRQTEG